jgi:hypothetical protein
MSITPAFRNHKTHKGSVHKHRNVRGQWDAPQITFNVSKIINYGTIDMSFFNLFYFLAVGGGGGGGVWGGGVFHKGFLISVGVFNVELTI